MKYEAIFMCVRVSWLIDKVIKKYLLDFQLRWLVDIVSWNHVHNVLYSLQEIFPKHFPKLIIAVAILVMNTLAT